MGEGGLSYNQQKKPSFSETGGETPPLRFLGGLGNLYPNFAVIIQINTVRTCRLSKIFVVFLVPLVFFRHFLDFLSDFLAKIRGRDHLRTTAPLQNLTH